MPFTKKKKRRIGWPLLISFLLLFGYLFFSPFTIKDEYRVHPQWVLEIEKKNVKRSNIEEDPSHIFQYIIVPIFNTIKRDSIR